MKNVVEITDDTKAIIDDMIRLGFFSDTQTLVAAAIGTLRAKLANETHSNEYEDNSYQVKMDKRQLCCNLDDED